MPFKDTELKAYRRTVWMIAKSRHVRDYIIGFTGQSVRKRFRPYRPNAFDYRVTICDGLNRADALTLEKYLFTEMQKAKGSRWSDLYQKYDRKRRDKGHRASFGGRGKKLKLCHSVYMVW